MRELSKVLLMVWLAMAPFSAHAQVATSAVVSVRDGTLYYEECGSGSQTIVLLHDGVVDSAVWNIVWADFCRQFHTVRYDRRGYGKSPSSHSAYSEIEDLVAVLDHAKASRASIIGSSHGGELAIDFTIAHPNRVEKLVLVGPVLNGMPFTDHFLHRADAPFELVRKGDVAAALILWSKDKYLIAPENDDARRQLLELLQASPQDMTHHDHSSRPPSAIHRLGEIKSPTLIVTGDADIPDVHAHSGAIEAGLKGARRVVVSGAGHILYLEKPKLFYDLVWSFLSASGR